MFDATKIPRHIAIIMDGNGRWAQKRNQPRVAGHKKGAETIKTIVRRANEIGIQMLTLFAFSTENWGRPEKEVNFLMNLPKFFFNDYIRELEENNVRIEAIGNLMDLPSNTREVIETAIARTQNNDGLILNFAINYGSQQEITQAMVSIANKIQNNDMTIDDITPSMIENHLETARFGDLAKPDLMIRTSGEMRLSNFLLWQLAYSEFYFTETLWPDFSPDELDQAVMSFCDRNRRFGKLN